MTVVQLAAWAMSALAASAGLTALGIALLMPVLRRYALAHANARSSHKTPTPQGGGIGVIAASVAVVLIAIPLLGLPLAPQSPVLAAAVFIALVGAVDDIHAVPVAPRLLLQLLAVAVAVAAIPADARILPLLPWIVERALLVLGLIWFVNLVNFMDGIDWITVAAIVPMTAALATMGLIGGLPVGLAILAAALCGGLLGFAPFNRPVARLFLGDVGSLPLGLLVGWLLATLAARGHLTAAILIPLYYVADATITLVRRILRGEAFWDAHRSHFYQRATDGGFSVLQIVARVFAVNAILATLAVVAALYPDRTFNLIALGAGAALVAGLLMTFARGRR
jgi:UDP-N-acetylmuramyl pentapeptide phosphotransferase/UDP-N-acetylglucosamine-1-phosphate transferase